MDAKLQEEIEYLEQYVKRFSPDKRLLAHALSFFTFFLLCRIGDLLLGVPIMVKFWNYLGLVISFLFIVMAFFLEKDIKRKMRKDETS